MPSLAEPLPQALATDTRQHERVTFFLLPVKREHIPVWIFVPPGFAHGVAALVMNLSEGGVQVFAPGGMEWSAGPLMLHLLDGDVGTAATRHFSIRVRRLWKKTVSHSGDLHGLAFDDDEEHAVRAYLARHRPDPLAGRWVRCVIEAVA
ncbi:hypothetical protein H5407_21650 [Mitsuaria sp. WAJ17]|uniref:hypothetical protein n=1 Tax=Mitsuaria sp. WAJ17 TaxID=2761452 RepID=UPI001601AE85|nr:hypothetical protein [Mitsuaria sp. WAJ17]MBB2487850.1 hypothetical protein [Mitsuaria sp. WAJ17]